MAVILNRKPSARQKRTAEAKMNNPDLQDTAIVALGGYGKSVQHTPQKVLESQGYLKALDELGLTDELITTSLVTDINAKPGKRERELRLGAEIRGMTKKDNSTSGGVVNNVFVVFGAKEKDANTPIQVQSTELSGPAS